MREDRTPGNAAVAIRRLSADDLPGALALSSTAGWNQRPDDWRLLLDIAPRGAFAAIAGGRVVGTAIGIDYGEFSWIAMMLVEPALRGQGLGRRLLEAALDAVPQDTPVRLDATPMGQPLYRTYGFEDETTLTRTVAQPEGRGATAATPPHEPVRTRAAAAADMPAILAHDRQAFGGNRAAVLGWAMRENPQYAHVVEQSGRAVQYCFGRRGRLFDQIGPIVADSDAGARALLHAATCAAAGRAVVVDLFDAQAGFAGTLRECGFAAERPLYRMRRPPRGGAAPTRPGAPTHAGPREYAIFGPEFA